MSGQVKVPQTPSPTRKPLLAPVLVASNSSPLPSRSKSPFANLYSPSLIIEDDEDDVIESEEESPIKDREASRWLEKQAWRSLGDDSSSPTLSPSNNVKSQGDAIYVFVDYDLSRALMSRP